MTIITKRNVTIGILILLVVTLAFVISKYGLSSYFAYDEGGGAGQGEPTNLPDLLPVGPKISFNYSDSKITAEVKTINFGKFATSQMTETSVGVQYSFKRIGKDYVITRAFDFLVSDNPDGAPDPDAGPFVKVPILAPRTSHTVTLYFLPRDPKYWCSQDPEPGMVPAEVYFGPAQIKADYNEREFETSELNNLVSFNGYWGAGRCYVPGTWFNEGKNQPGD